MMHSRGGSCPRCKGYTGLSVRGGDNPKMYQHRTPYGTRCPAGGITHSQAKAGWTALSLNTYRWLLANKPGGAEAYRVKHTRQDTA